MKKHISPRHLVKVLIIFTVLHISFSNSITLDKFKSLVKKYISVFLIQETQGPNKKKLEAGFTTYFVKQYSGYKAMSELQLDGIIQRRIKDVWANYSTSDEILSIFSQ